MIKKSQEKLWQVKSNDKGCMLHYVALTKRLLTEDIMSNVNVSVWCGVQHEKTTICLLAKEYNRLTQRW